MKKRSCIWETGNVASQRSDTCMSHRRALREQRIAVPLSEKVVQRRTAPTVAVRWARARGQDLHRQSRFPAMLRSTTYGVTNAEPRKKGKWSGKRDSNSRLPPWQGGALPTELFPLYRLRYRAAHFSSRHWCVNCY